METTACILEFLLRGIPPRSRLTDDRKSIHANAGYLSQVVQTTCQELAVWTGQIGRFLLQLPVYQGCGSPTGAEVSAGLRFSHADSEDALQCTCKIMIVA